MALYFDTKQYQEALSLGSALLKELKKLDDKNLLVEVRRTPDAVGLCVEGEGGGVRVRVACGTDD